MPLSICKRNKQVDKKKKKKTNATKKTDFPLDSACRVGYLLKTDPGGVA